MRLNVQQLFDRIDDHLDRVSSARWTSDRKVRELNQAVEKIIEDRYDNIKQKKTYSFQSNQKLRDELRPFVVLESPLTVVSGNKVSLPDDYRHELRVQVTVDGIDSTSDPIPYDELGTILVNPFQKPTRSDVKHVEDSQGLTFYFGSYGTLSSVLYTYLRKPVTIFYSNVTLTQADPLEVGKTYVVTSGTVTEGGATYQNREDFVATTTSFTGTGTLVEIVNTDLPDILHEELAEKTSKLMSQSVLDVDRSTLINQEMEQS